MSRFWAGFCSNYCDKFEVHSQKLFKLLVHIGQKPGWTFSMNEKKEYSNAFFWKIHQNLRQTTESSIFISMHMNCCIGSRHFLMMI